VPCRTLDKVGDWNYLHRGPTWSGMKDATNSDVRSHRLESISTSQPRAWGGGTWQVYAVAGRVTRNRSKTMILLGELNLINECQAAFRRNHYRHPRRFTKRLRSSRMMSMTPRCGAFPRAIRRRGPLCALAHRVTRNVGPSASRRLRLVYVEWQPECKRRSTSQLACHCDVTSKRLRE
jgi:hypothetical protein